MVLNWLIRYKNQMNHTSISIRRRSSSSTYPPKGFRPSHAPSSHLFRKQLKSESRHIQKHKLQKYESIAGLIYKILMGVNIILFLILSLVWIPQAFSNPPSRIIHSRRHHVTIDPLHASRDMNAFKSVNSSKSSQICVFGNAESRQTARFASVQWPDFPVVMAVWGSDAKSISSRGEIHTPNLLLFPASGTSHAEGWEISLKYYAQGTRDRQDAMRSFVQKQKSHVGLDVHSSVLLTHPPCNYFLATDDDVAWHVTEVGSRVYRRHYNITDMAQVETPTDLINHLVREYHPGFVGFNWDFGDTHKPAMINLATQYGRRVQEHYEEILRPTGKPHGARGASLVQPLTGFDNGCLLFAASLVEFFTPLWLGEGWTPNFIVQHAQENFVIPQLLRSQAMRFNGLSYTNPRANRHPYDAIKDYKAYLNKHVIRCKRWGEDLVNDDVVWLGPERGKNGKRHVMFHVDRDRYMMPVGSSFYSGQGMVKKSTWEEWQLREDTDTAQKNVAGVLQQMDVDLKDVVEGLKEEFGIDVCRLFNV